MGGCGDTMEVKYLGGVDLLAHVEGSVLWRTGSMYLGWSETPSSMQEDLQLLVHVEGECLVLGRV